MGNQKAKLDFSATVTVTSACYIFFIVMLINLPLLSAQSIHSREANNESNKQVETDGNSSVNNQLNQNPPVDKSNQKETSTATLESSKVKDSHHVNCSLPKNANLTICKDNDDGMVSYFLNKMSSNSGMLFRTMYVLLAVTGIVIVYFAIKAIRLRRRKSKSRKYGIITKQGDHGDMEMEPLGDGMDEDDDYTVFEMGRRK